MLDMKDPATWYFLGNAYFSNFVANFKKFDELENAIKAYNEAVISDIFRKSISSANIPIYLLTVATLSGICKITSLQSKISKRPMKLIVLLDVWITCNGSEPEWNLLGSLLNE
jgi:hypothetical protein